MDERVNLIKSGAYSGYHILPVTINNREYACIKELNMPLTRSKVKSIEVLNGNTGNHAIQGAVIGGVAGAIVGSQISDMLIKITWQNGSESVAEVRSGMYSIMQSTLYLPEISSESVKKEQDNTKMIGIIIGIIWLVVYFFASASG